MTLRKEAIEKIKLLSLDDVSKLLFFMAGTPKLFHKEHFLI